MNNEIENLVDTYESGQMTRRQLVAKLGMMMGFVSGVGQLWASESDKAEPENIGSTFEAVEINHIALRVTNITRSRDFYTKHLGLKVARQSSNSCFLNCGNNFVALFRGREAGLDHYCYAVEDYDVNKAEQKLRAEGLDSVRRQGNRIYFNDPDGLTVQLAAKNHLP